MIHCVKKLILIVFSGSLVAEPINYAMLKSIIITRRGRGSPKGSAGRGITLVLSFVYTVPDPHGHDIKLNSSTTSEVVIEKSGESKYDRKLPELDVVTKRTRYRVNGVLVTKNGILGKIGAGFGIFES